MSTSINAVRRANKLLSKHSDFIIDIWEQGCVTKDADNAQIITDLSHLQIVVEIETDVFYLNSSIKNYYDEISRRTRNYTVSEDLRGLYLALIQTSQSIRTTRLENDHDAANTLIFDFRGTLSTLIQSLDRTISRLRLLADTEYGNVASFADKQRQNQYYLTKISEIIATLKSLEDEKEIKEIYRDPLLEECAILLRRQLSPRIERSYTRLNEIIHILRNNLFTLTRITKNTHNIQRYLLQRRENPNWSLAEALLDIPQATQQAWWHLAESIPTKTYPNVNNPKTEPFLADIVQSIERKTPDTTPEKNNALTPILPDIETPPIIIETDPLDDAYDIMLEQAVIAKRPASALDFYTANPNLQNEASLAVWLFHVEWRFSTDLTSPYYCTITTQYLPYTRHDAMLDMIDIILTPEDVTPGSETEEPSQGQVETGEDAIPHSSLTHTS